MKTDIEIIRKLIPKINKLATISYIIIFDLKSIITTLARKIIVIIILDSYIY